MKPNEVSNRIKLPRSLPDSPVKKGAGSRSKRTSSAINIPLPEKVSC